MDDRRISLQELVNETDFKATSRAGACFYCGQLATRLEYDHFPIPHEFGGDQIVPACQTCHDLKDRLDLWDWPAEAIRAAFEGLTPMAGLLLGKVLAEGLRTHRGRPQGQA